MRRQTPIAHLLYNHLFPHPGPNDPPSFSAHLARNLVPEVRIEVATFYGDLNSTEARYPGLNYAYGPHRLRLGRFKHHKRLFGAFDELGLTYGEIQDFCCWEGTKWARERYEKDEGIKVLDTTGDDIGPYIDRRHMKPEDEIARRSITRKTDISVIVEDPRPDTRPSLHPEPTDEEMSDADSEGEIEDAYQHTYSDAAQQTEPRDETLARDRHVANLQRAREQVVHQRIIAAWESGQSLPPEIEQYLKEQSDRGVPSTSLDLRAILSRSRRPSASSNTTVPTSRAGPLTERAAA